MHVRAVLLALTLAACGGSACSPPRPPSPEKAWNGPKTYFVETPVGSKKWEPAAGEPEWVKSPPQRDGWIRVVAENASDLREIATEKTWPPREFGPRIEGPLTRIVGADKARLAVKFANRSCQVLARATREEDGPNPAVPGNHFVQAWALWEVAIDDVVAAVPAEQRDAARAALAAGK